MNHEELRKYGVKIDDDMVTVFDWWQTTPVLHNAYGLTRRTFIESGSGREVMEYVTRCGKAVDTYIESGRDDFHHQAHGAMVPLRHAEKFGRPCKRCWR